MKKALILFVAFSTAYSCSKEKEKPQKEADVKKSSVVSKKWKQTKEIFVDSDSVISIRKDKYFTKLKTTYLEYDAIGKWFESKPRECLGEGGDYYKMLKNEVDNNNTITHNDLSKLSNSGTYKYLYSSKTAFYIYDLALNNGRCIYKGVRRIKKGYGSQPVHDLLFDDKGELSKEIYQGEMKSDLYAKNGHLFFSFEKKSGDEKVKNTIDLGDERGF